MGRADERDRDAIATLHVSIACSPRAGVAFEVDLALAAPVTALEAVRASGVLERCPELATGEPSIGIWGRAVSGDALVRDGDRIELYRPLAADPKDARRRRADVRKGMRRDPPLRSG
jgi:putative ubiquitin-RnfH superfamily antitoxin RatB of RatAB toxin-antitoxin module